MKSLIFCTICILLFISMMLVLTNLLVTKEKIDCFTFTSEITVDGKWTSSDEWNFSNEKILTFGKGTGEAYLRVIHGEGNIYVMVDIVSYNKTETGDSCIVVFDTENDGGSSTQSDDLAILIRWNSPSEILPGI